MDKQTYVIGVLAIIATILFVANLMPLAPQTASAETVVRDNRFQMVTTRGQRGGQSLYVIDNLTGQVVCLAWENNTVKPVVIRPLTEIFKQ